MIVTETLKKAVKLFGQKEGLVCGRDRLTYKEAYERVGGLAQFLASQGIGKGDKVAVLCPNCHRFFEVYYALAFLGAPTVPLNWRLTPKEIAFILEDSESTFLIADRRFGELVEAALAQGPKAIKGVLWAGRGEAPGLQVGAFDYEEVVEALRGVPPEVPYEEDHIAQIYYTSGTTGRPKGVILTHKNICVHALGTVAELHLSDSDRWIHVAPMFHLADAWATWAITWVGGTHIFVGTFDPGLVLETIERERATITNMIPTML
ncbi:TPA: hypothetical protein EYP84_04610, partial [Candidatus Bipolaricaulota bacterium]|nr:hypothetical protein [Candidatus Bipolaricaulota bacterium]